MSKRRRLLAPFTVVLTHPTDPTAVVFNSNRVQLIRNRMDLAAANPIVKSFVAGSLSGTCSTILFQPLDLVKTRLQQATSQATSSRRMGMVGVARHVLQTEHVRGLWKGILPSITRTVPGVGLYFSSLHWLKSHVTPVEDERGQPSPFLAVCLGMAARSFSGCVMIPITVLKTRFESGAYNYQGMSYALASIYRSEGVRGLCCGLLPTLVRDAPFSGLYLMFYTQLKFRVTLLQSPNRPSSSASLVDTLTHFSCGLTAGLMASFITHPADVVKTKMQLYPREYASVRGTVFKVLRSSGVRGFMVGLLPRMLRRTLMSAFAWTVYEEIMRKAGLK